ncbi:multiprotein-bridging factor 1 family protein [Amycolatopsis sp. NPDC052450]|uniref:multiprotein-bridging factor 1 family protein n=1 Tax=Amycolatopsis sp. NPDC052450 TaxID=3363937 RepID=UPI0037CC5F98
MTQGVHTSLLNADRVRLYVSALRANLGGTVIPADEGPARFGELLRSHRHSLGTTQRVLAARSSVSVRAIRDLEHGRVGRPRRDTVRLIAAGLGLSGQARADFERAAVSYRPTTGTSAPGTRRRRRPV